MQIQNTLPNRAPKRRPIVQAARHIADHLPNYHTIPVRTNATERTFLLVESFHKFFYSLFPDADDEVIRGLVELCALEAGRARLMAQLDRELNCDCEIYIDSEHHHE